MMLDEKVAFRIIAKCRALNLIGAMSYEVREIVVSRVCDAFNAQEKWLYNGYLIDAIKNVCDIEYHDDEIYSIAELVSWIASLLELKQV